MIIVRVIERLLDALDSSGGHIAVLIGLLGLGLHFNSMELIVAAMSALFVVLRTPQSNQARRDGAKEDTT